MPILRHEPGSKVPVSGLYELVDHFGQRRGFLIRVDSGGTLPPVAAADLSLWFVRVDESSAQVASDAARVIVAGCPRCGSGDYITTEPDWTEENNLLDLPRF